MALNSSMAWSNSSRIACLHTQINGKRDRRKVGCACQKADTLQVLQALTVNPFLDPGNALVVNIGIAEHMGCGDTVGIDTLVLGQKTDPGNAEAMHLRALARGKISRFT